MKKCFYFFIICFEKNLSNMKSRILIQSSTKRQHRTKIHLLSKLWAVYWLPLCELAPVSPKRVDPRPRTGDSQLVPMSTRPISTRTHVSSYPCQLVPMSTRTTNRCQLVLQVMSTRTTSDVNSYPTRQVSDDGMSWHLSSHNRFQLVPMSTRSTNRCQLVPSLDVNSYQS